MGTRIGSAPARDAERSRGPRVSIAARRSPGRCSRQSTENDRASTSITDAPGGMHESDPTVARTVVPTVQSTDAVFSADLQVTRAIRDYLGVIWTNGGVPIHANDVPSGRSPTHATWTMLRIDRRQTRTCRAREQRISGGRSGHRLLAGNR